MLALSVQSACVFQEPSEFDVQVELPDATVAMAAVAWGLWTGLDGLVGRSGLGQIVSVGVAGAGAFVLYGKAVLTMRIPEARQIQQLVAGKTVRKVVVVLKKLVNIVVA